MSKLSDKLKNLFAKTRNAPGKGAYPAKFEQRAFKAGQKTTAMMKNIASKSLFKKGTVGKPSNVAKSLSKELITASAAKKLRTASKIAKIGRAITPVGLGLTAANVIYDVATMSPEKKAKVKKLKTKLSKTSTKDYHADLMKMSTGGDTMLKGGQKKLDKNKDGKISGEDFEIIKKTSKAQVSDKEAQKVMKRVGGGAATKGMGAVVGGSGLQDEELIPGKSLDYYKDIM
jgi:hypothetical protein